MRSRRLAPRTGARVSVLGLDCARLPAGGDAPGRVDEAAAAALLHEAIEAGVTYLAATWGAQGGAGEALLGRELGVRRAAICLAARLPADLAAVEADWDRVVTAQLERLATDRLDLAILHGLTPGRWERARRSGGLEALERARAGGRLLHLGFSCRGAPGLFREILEAFDWDCCEVELDLLGEGAPLGPDALRLAAGRGLGIAVAEPLRGHSLAAPPPVVQDAWARSLRTWTPTQWALRWVWDHAEVTTAATPFATAAQLREAVAAAGGQARLTAADQAVVEAVRRTYRTRRRVPCAICGCCQPCVGAGVAIPDVLSLYNDARFDSKAGPQEAYRALRAAGRGADRCTACGDCEARCPEGLPIMATLPAAHRYLSAG